MRASLAVCLVVSAFATTVIASESPPRQAEDWTRFAPFRTITFEERVAAQRAIEEVYWKHRLWPNENPVPKPPLSAVMADDAIREKVRDYLSKSAALDALWHRPVTAVQLQAE